MESLASYGWIVICSGFLAFFTAFGIGASPPPRRLSVSRVATREAQIANPPTSVSTRRVPRTRPNASSAPASLESHAPPRSLAHAHRSSSPVLSGANDVSNAFATSVGSGALTLRDAVAIAAVCEFSGAVLMGGAVTETIRKGIADVTAYEREPEVLMYGMMCVLLAVGLWLVAATKLGFPVSTTHSTVGAVVGMSMVARGASSVYWGSETTRTFPWLTGVAKIILSWVFSPILSAAAAAGLFVALRALVLRRADPARAALAAFPVIVGLTAALNAFLLLSKGTATRGGTGEWANGTKAGVCLGVGAGALVAAAALVPALRRRAAAFEETAKAKYAARARRASEGGAASSARASLDDTARDDTEKCSDTVRVSIDGARNGGWPRRDSFTSFQGGLGTSKPSASDSERSDAPSSAATEEERLAAAEEERREFGCHYGLREWAMARMTPSYELTTEKVVAGDSRAVRDVHARAERFDAKAEMLLTYLQVFTACVDSFAHGANDVANACGPFAAIWGIYSTSETGHDMRVPLWVLVIGGCGLVIGLASLGVNIIKQIGMRLSKITPSRGLCIELGAAIVVLVGTKFGVPLSTTHCQVGATTGVALLEGSGGVNWKLLARVVFGWAITLAVAALAAAAFTAQGLYAPHIERHVAGDL
jgi:sodium-dependent phosphate transporter